MRYYLKDYYIYYINENRRNGEATERPPRPYQLRQEGR